MAVETRHLSIPLLLPSEGDCESCISRLKDSLLQTKGVLSADVDSMASRLVLRFDPTILTLDSLERRAKEAGIEVTQQFSHETFRLAGLDCPDCARTLEGGIARLPGVVWVAVSVPASRMLVEYSASELQPRQISQQVAALGYEVVGAQEERSLRKRLLANRRLVVTIVCSACALAGWVFSLLDQTLATWSLAFYLAAVAIGGYPIARGALGSIRARMIDMNVLMTTSVIGAAIIGHTAESAAVVVLYAVGNTLEGFTMDRTRRALEVLMKLAPDTARVKNGEGEEVVPTTLVQVGQIVVIRPGERIPLDGEIMKGASSLDESTITGESMPVQKAEGDSVWAGSINQFGSLDVRVTRPASESTLARILALIESAETQKTPSQRLIDRFARYYTPAVIVVAIGIAVVPHFFIGWPTEWPTGWRQDPWIYNALALLLVSCPCALVIASPVAVVAALSAAAREGVLVKGGLYLEQVARIRAIAFDKTGTLTAGKAVVTDVIGLDGASSDDVLAVAAAVESRSEHHIAEAILSAAYDKGVQPAPTVGFQALPGIGAQAHIDGIFYQVGSPRLLPGSVDISNHLDALASQGKTVVIVLKEATPFGLIALADQPRQEALEVVSRLRDLGISHLAMLTGDNAATARAVATAVGIDDWRAELLPHEKVDVVKSLGTRWGTVSMVGDGINDAPALAASDLGVAMGVAGTDVALETADAVLMGDDLSKLPYFINLGRRTVAVMRQNIFLSVLVKAGFIALVFPNWLTMWLAIVGDTGVSLLVMVNGMRLLARRRRPVACRI